MKSLKVIAVILLCIINVTGVKEITAINRDYYKYSNYGGTYTIYEIPSQGRTFNGVVKTCSFPQFLQKYPGTHDTIVYRLFKINPLKFWRWYEYIFDWRYSLPYESWEAVVKRRGYGALHYSHGFQEF